ncbi:interferon-induced, double-stranded RNA-activated protein kinase-like [Cheilinus undulatus]|uniref:interferon-induced, double-stranded RNA-activated protein kinase-like n=1 Tax=Cheilinus undulatus TaxID=241271 RepID=UPI001BD20FE4|nr:interferon-induced, double-stranded RNA-activated protein kinase-like [Cheilinus undulatus]
MQSARWKEKNIISLLFIILIILVTTTCYPFIMACNNYLDRLSTYARTHDLTLKYEPFISEGPDHDKTFITRAVVGGKHFPKGNGKRKIDAKRSAAAIALDHLLKSSNEIQRPVRSVENAAGPSTAPLYQGGDQNMEVTVPASQPTGNETNTTQSWQFVPPASTKKLKGKTKAARLDDGMKRDGEEDESLVHAETMCFHSTSHEDFCILVEYKFPKEQRSSDQQDYANQNKTRSQNGFMSRSTAIMKTSFESSVSKDGASFKISSQISTMPTWEHDKSSLQSNSLCQHDFAGPSDCPEVQTSQNPRDDGKNAKPQASKRRSSDNQDAVGHKKRKKNRKKSPNDISAPGPEFTRKFCDIEDIGCGGYGCVHKAKLKTSGEFFAVKIVRCDEKSFREVSMLSKVKHPNIVRYYSFWTGSDGYKWNDKFFSASSSGSDGDSPKKFLYIQMELCKTTSLKDWIKKKNTQSLSNIKRWKQAFGIALQIAKALECIHAKGFIHRDIKPGNILFGLDDKVKIGDFGLVTLDDTSKDRTAYQGSPRYMAPEQFNDKAYDRKVDIFSLCLIILELFCKSMKDEKVFKAARGGKLPKDFPQDFLPMMQIIKPMLDEKPQNRPEAEEVVTALEEVSARLMDQKPRSN